MKRISSVAIVAAFIAAAMPSALLADDTMHDRSLNQWFTFAGLRTRFDSIQSVAQADGNKILTDVSAEDLTKGYLIITIEYQNPTSGTDLPVPGINYSFELSDGSTFEGSASATYGPYVGDASKPAPDTLHPKEHIKVRYVIVGWDSTSITKMFVERNSGDDTGDSNDRFEIKKGDITPLAPVPTPTPGN